jgi:uncharacterized glyoxalase superfamily metalloenzyme YdcJ
MPKFTTSTVAERAAAASTLRKATENIHLRAPLRGFPQDMQTVRDAAIAAYENRQNNANGQTGGKKKATASKKSATASKKK